MRAPGEGQRDAAQREATAVREREVPQRDVEHARDSTTNGCAAQRLRRNRVILKARRRRRISECDDRRVVAAVVSVSPRSGRPNLPPATRAGTNYTLDFPRLKPGAMLFGVLRTPAVSVSPRERALDLYHPASAGWTRMRP